MEDRKLSINFSLNEFLHSQIASREGGSVQNEQMNPPQEIIEALEYHVNRTVQPARTELGVGITISSGYRCPTVNTMAKGSKTSQHVKGEASDQSLSHSFFNNHQVKTWLNDLILGITDHYPRSDVNASYYLWAYYCIFRHKCDIDQVIHEYGTCDGQPAWVHVSSSRSGDRREMLVKRTGEGYKRLTLVEALMLGCSYD